MNINLRAPYNSLGYGIVGKNVLRGLYNAGQSVSFFPIGQIQPEAQSEAEILNACLQNGDLYDNSAPCVNIWHQHSLAETIGKGKSYAFPIFELDTFTEREKHHLSHTDELFVASKWAKLIIEKNGITNTTHVIPLGVDTSIFRPISVPKNKTTVFLNIGKMEVRKSIDHICDIYNKAFTPDDDVVLLMAVANPFLKEEDFKQWMDYYKNSKMGNKIQFVPRLPSQEQVNILMNQADCCLSLSKAEGFDLEALEMMACGKQIIATNYSAHTEFCTINNSHLIDIDEEEEAFDGIWFHGEGNWAHIGERQINQCVEDMRFIHEQKQSGKDLTNYNGIETAKQFSWKNTSDLIIKALQ